MEAKWDKESLYRLIKERLGSYHLIVVSNREPYIHTFSDGRITCHRPVGGLTEALDPVMRASQGIWVAQASGNADKSAADAIGHVRVPPEKPEYTLRRVWLTQEEINGFYLGFSNSALWPLCHISFTSPVYRKTDWETYKKVNQIFADAILEEVGDHKALVLVQDYHFALLSRILKKRNPHLIAGQFWHIPWTPYEVFRTCPWQEEILKGLLGNDLIGFHTRSYCNNFLDSVRHCLKNEAGVGASSVNFDNRFIRVEPFPISVDFDRLSREADTQAVTSKIESLKGELGLEGKYIGVSMDRVDYTKGIANRLEALKAFFEDYPYYRGKVVFIQAGMPSRTEIDSYRDIDHKIIGLTNKINEAYGNDSWKPIVSISGQLSPVALNALRRMANFLIVSSLHDGMNLVAKEYVASRVDEDGVLILSEFTGAAVEMGEALLINPFATSEFARNIKKALEMPESERRRRMRKMRETISINNIYKWGASIFSRLISIAEA